MTPKVAVRWSVLPNTSDHDRAQVALDIAETLSGDIQRRLDAPELLTAATGRTSTVQAREPISYAEARERLVGLEWIDVSANEAALLTDRGRGKRREWRARQYAGRSFDRVSDSPIRRPAAVNLRPGRGGFQPRKLDAERIDPASGMDGYGEATWWRVSGGATLGIIEVNPDGNGAACLRLSGDDYGETLVAQMRTVMALAERYDELKIRYALCAIEMEGWRDVVLAADGLQAHNLTGRKIRDDVLVIERWIGEGWLEHVVFRDQRRIARDMIPGEQIIRFLKDNRLGLWLADLGRKIDYVADRATLRFYNVLAAEDRDNINRSMQTARVNKGPLAGKGWGTLPFGFYRDRNREPVQDKEQWPFVLRAFELADALGAKDPGKFSVRQVARLLADEGCPFSRSQIYRLLARPIYATGEYTVKVRAIPVIQDPIPLIDPVPIDRFQRVQELLALRRGGSTRTELGECLLNSVDCVHQRCANEDPDPKSGRTLRISGHRQKGRRHDHLVYRHVYGKVPECCQSGGRNRIGGFTWLRDDIDPVLARAVRELASHPEVLRQAAQAARHAVAPTSTRLTDDQRAAVERECQALEVKLQQLTDEWIGEAARRGGDLDLDGYQRISSAIRRRVDAAETRLRTDASLAQAEMGQPGAGDVDRTAAFLLIMTEETPSDPLLRQLRARLFQRIVSRVVIEDDGGEEVTLVIEGHLVPESAPLEMGNPILACADLLDSYSAVTEGRKPDAEQRLEQQTELRAEVETVSGVSSDETVSTIYTRLHELASGRELRRLESRTLADTGWHRDRISSLGGASWRLCTTFLPMDAIERWPEKFLDGTKLPAREREIIEYLRANGGCALRLEMSAHFGINPMSLNYRMSSLLATGLVEKVRDRGNGPLTYRLTQS